MKIKTKLILTLAAITMATLACATVTASNTSDQPAPPAELPTNTPLPPFPTSTPPPPTPEPTTPVPLTGNAVFFDDFSNSESGWDRYSSEDTTTDYANGAYKIGVYKTTWMAWANPYQDFGDQIIDVQATVMSTEADDQYGIICRHQDVDNWYALVISSDGAAAIRKKFQGGKADYLLDWVKVPAINLGDATNNLHVECIGNRLTLFVNGEFVFEVFDDDIPTGDAGLIAGTFTATLVEVLFDNFQVSTP